MNNFSDKDLLSIDHIFLTTTLNTSSFQEHQKTQNLNSNTHTQTHHQISFQSSHQTSFHNDDHNDADQKTTISSQNTQKIYIQAESIQEIQDHTHFKTLSDSAIYHQGFIMRKQKGFISTWEKRYAVLTKGKLFFFETQFKNNLIGCIYVKYLPVSIIQNEDTFEFSASQGGETIELKGLNSPDHLVWVQKMKNVISFCKNQQKVCIRKFNLTVYEQKDFALEEQFIKNAETGDLLLVSSQNSASYLQKFLTHSQFNHVAMIIRFQDQLKIFQANEDDGVFIYDWKQYLQIFKDHKRFAWRKLVYPGKSKYEEKLKELVKKFIGRSYSITSTRIFRRTSHDSEDQEERQFFCSQIVAKLYKTLGLLDKDVSSVRYWPISFTSRGELNLKDGAYFSLQKNILLQKHLKI